MVKVQMAVNVVLCALVALSCFVSPTPLPGAEPNPEEEQMTSSVRWLMQTIPDGYSNVVVNQYIVDHEGRRFELLQKEADLRPAIDCRDLVVARLPKGAIKQLFQELPIASAVLVSRVEGLLPEGADGRQTPDTRWCCVLTVKANGDNELQQVVRTISGAAKVGSDHDAVEHRLSVMFPRAGDGRPVVCAHLGRNRLLLANDESLAALMRDRAGQSCQQESPNSQLVLDTLRECTGCIVATRPPIGNVVEPKLLVIADSATTSRVRLDITFASEQDSDARPVLEWFIGPLERGKRERVLRATRLVDLGMRQIQCVWDAPDADVDYCAKLATCELLGFLVGP